MLCKQMGRNSLMWMVMRDKVAGHQPWESPDWEPVLMKTVWEQSCVYEGSLQVLPPPATAKVELLANACISPVNTQVEHCQIIPPPAGTDI